MPGLRLRLDPPDGSRGTAMQIIAVLPVDFEFVQKSDPGVREQVKDVPVPAGVDPNSVGAFVSLAQWRLHQETGGPPGELFQDWPNDSGVMCEFQRRQTAATVQVACDVIHRGPTGATPYWVTVAALVTFFRWV